METNISLDFSSGGDSTQREEGVDNVGLYVVTDEVAPVVPVDGYDGVVVTTVVVVSDDGYVCSVCVVVTVVVAVVVVTVVAVVVVAVEEENYYCIV